MLTATVQVLFRLHLDAVIAGSYQISIASARFVIDPLQDPNDPFSLLCHHAGQPKVVIAPGPHRSKTTHENAAATPNADGIKTFIAGVRLLICPLTA